MRCAGFQMHKYLKKIQNKRTFMFALVLCKRLGPIIINIMVYLHVAYPAIV